MWPQVRSGEVREVLETGRALRWGAGARRAGVKTGGREEAHEQRMLEVPRGRCGCVGRSQGLKW